MEAVDQWIQAARSTTFPQAGSTSEIVPEEQCRRYLLTFPLQLARKQGPAPGLPIAFSLWPKTVPAAPHLLDNQNLMPHKYNKQSVLTPTCASYMFQKSNSKDPPRWVRKHSQRCSIDSWGGRVSRSRPSLWGVGSRMVVTLGMVFYFYCTFMNMLPVTYHVVRGSL